MPLATERLRLRRLTLDDAPFILDLVNQPSWLENIGDKGVRGLDDARDFLRNGPLAMYARHGFGLYCIERAADGAAMGLCGLIKRDTLDDVDIGYALLPQYWGQGYAREAAAATLEHGVRDIGLQRIVAITSPGNGSSARLLESLGFRFERMLSLSRDDEVKLFGWSPA
ncbi:GNAT family N-acetyltransferase [Aerolutibacter ruishenii]|uniref:RimJ/RimL family protein N-acetyltransferase n=1 Tax=Aerolutibacter ruishenii TaxID=686800 RepID=A0A562LIA5_9GAMM|nr:GNAT family N-acetyltransferase [Lysobacter ruishenii]TWI07352.1 RimJ/RimL family protein N-acetyltransferase [Lysobacter ruishenii]